MDFWTLSLAVEADDARRVLTPRIRIEGGTPFAAGVVLVALVDPDERTCATVHRPLDPADIGIELTLPPILVPGGVPVERALEWGWDVGVATDGLERIRWRRYLEVGSADVGDDAEIRLRWPPDGLRSKAEDEGWGPEAPWDARDTDRLLSSLLVQGIITEADRKAVVAEVQARGVTAEQTLVEQGHDGESCRAAAPGSMCSNWARARLRQTVRARPCPHPVDEVGSMRSGRG